MQTHTNITLTHADTHTATQGHTPTSHSHSDMPIHTPTRKHANIHHCPKHTQGCQMSDLRGRDGRTSQYSEKSQSQAGFNCTV